MFKLAFDSEVLDSCRPQDSPCTVEKRVKKDMLLIIFFNTEI